jgi:hypothetical protein
MNEFKLGSELKCKVTGFKGIAVARIVYLNGCIQYCVKPKANLKEGKMIDGEYIDVGQLEESGKGINVKKKETGGPQRDCPK